MFESVESTGKEIRKFVTGSVRDNAEGKGRWDLIPYYPLLRVAVHFENGAKKYGDRNWEKGQPLNEYLSSAMRHLTRFANGENGEDHLSACIWNCMAFLETENKIVERGSFNLDQVNFLIEKLHPEIAKRIRKKLHEKNVTAKLQEMGGELKEALDKANLFGKLNLPEIQVGDNVYVREDAKDHFAGRICFAQPMEKMIGKVFKVEEISPVSLTGFPDRTTFPAPDLMYKLIDDNNASWWFTRGSLNKVVETTNEA